MNVVGLLALSTGHLYAPENIPGTHGGRRDSSVGIATRYVLDGPEIESRWGRDFPHRSRPLVGPTQPPI